MDEKEDVTRMPLYTFKCDTCDKVTEEMVSVADRDNGIVCECEEGIKQRQIDYPKSVWSPTRNGGNSR
jgi:putative FmdB family regulatory protein